MRVMFDIDGVLAEFVLGYTRLAQKLGWHGKPYSTLMQPGWEFFNIPPNICRATWEEIDRLGSKFWESLEPLTTPENFVIIDHLANYVAGCEVQFVTSRGQFKGDAEPIRQATVKWLEAQGVRNPRVIVSPDKGDIAHDWGATHLIDDKAGNAVYAAYRTRRMGTKVYLLDTPYNQFDQHVLGTKVRRIHKLEEFLDDCLLDAQVAK